jgi:hypothetical protein
MGLITGAGFCTLLDSVKRKLAVEQVTDTERVLGIISEETERTLNAWRAHHQIESWIAQTGWIFSYTTLLNDQPLLRVGVFHPSLNREMYVTYEVGDPAIIFPLELDSGIAKVIYDLVQQKIRVPTDAAELQSSIEQSSTVIGLIISELQPHCPSISRRFQIGIQTGGQTGISDLVDIRDDGTFSLNIRLDSPSSDRAENVRLRASP